RCRFHHEWFGSRLGVRQVFRPAHQPARHAVSPALRVLARNASYLQRGGNSAPFLFSIRWKHWDRESGPASLLQRRVAHAEARPYMLGEQLNRGAVGDRIGLCQILHGLDQAALAVNIAGIRSAFSSFATET